LPDAQRSGRPRTIAPPTRVQVLSVARAVPHAQHRTITRWTLAERVATGLDALNAVALSRSSLWRLLHDVDLQPHQSAYWLNSHAADFDATARHICHVSAQALEA
jgi:transposase